MEGEEKKVAALELRKLRLERLKSMSEQEILKGQLIRMKLLMKDYFELATFLKDFSFANQLKNYIDLLKITHRQFAEDIGIHKTRLSRLINDREDPNIELLQQSNNSTIVHLKLKINKRYHLRTGRLDDQPDDQGQT